MRSVKSVMPMLLAVAACATAAHADDVLQLSFARVGTSYSAFIGSDNPAVGRRVISTRIVLRLQVTAGDAADFTTDLLVPVAADPGATSVVFESGLDRGWSGVGLFEIDEIVTSHNGTVIARRFGAATPGDGYDGEILDGSMVELRFETACPADFNADGFLDFFDYSDFVACFETGTCPDGRTADFNSDDFVDFFDYSDYATAFETGC
jgi:hypothetical protein